MKWLIELDLTQRYEVTVDADTEEQAKIEAHNAAAQDRDWESKRTIGDATFLDIQIAPDLGCENCYDIGCYRCEDENGEPLRRALGEPKEGT